MYSRNKYQNQIYEKKKLIKNVRDENVSRDFTDIQNKEDISISSEAVWNYKKCVWTKENWNCGREIAFPCLHYFLF